MTCHDNDDLFKMRGENTKECKVLHLLWREGGAFREKKDSFSKFNAITHGADQKSQGNASKEKDDCNWMRGGDICALMAHCFSGQERHGKYV